jgi:O-antigen ligase
VFQARFFDSGSGTLEYVFRGDFLSLGRFESWPDIWDEAWRRPLLGHGIGTATKFVSLVWPEVSLVHNDYLRIGFELGLVGLAIFLVVMGWQLFAIRRLLTQRQPQAETGNRALSRGTTPPRMDHPTGAATQARVVQHALSAAFLGLVVFLIMACTDNPLTYNIWFTNPVFVLLGGAYGVLHAQRTAEAGNSAQRLDRSRLDAAGDML